MYAQLFWAKPLRSDIGWGHKKGGDSSQLIGEAFVPDQAREEGDAMKRVLTELPAAAAMTTGCEKTLGKWAFSSLTGLPRPESERRRPMRTLSRCWTLFPVILAACLAVQPGIAKDRLERGSQPLYLNPRQFEVLDSDFRPKGTEPQCYLATGPRHTRVVDHVGEVILPLWGGDTDFGPAMGVSMCVVPAGSYKGRTFVARMWLDYSGPDSICTYYSSNGGPPWTSWWKIYTNPGWDFNDFSICCARDRLAVFYQIKSSTEAVIGVYFFPFSGGYDYYEVDRSTTPTTEMHPDCVSDAEDHSTGVWYYLVYSTEDYSAGVDLRFVAIDQSGGQHSACFLDGAGSSKTYWDGDIDWDGGNLFATWHVLDDGDVRARFSSNGGSSWTSKMDISSGHDDSQPRIAGHGNDACVVMEDQDNGIAYNFTTNFGSTWAGPYIPGQVDSGDLTPAITECHHDSRYGIYFSNEGNRAHKSWMVCTDGPWQGEQTIGDAWADIRQYSHCYEIRYLRESTSGDDTVGVVWIDDRTGADHAWYDYGCVGVEEHVKGTSSSSCFALLQNSPNPARNTTEIAYTLPCKAEVKLDVFDISGCRMRQLVNESQSGGPHIVSWDLRDGRNKDLPAGIYFYKLTARHKDGRERGGLISTKKMVLVR